jgi:hypothetical protein
MSDTDGRDRHDGAAPGAAEATAAETDAAIEAAAVAQAAGDDAEGPTSAEYSVAFTPRNLAVGLAIVAGLVAFAASRRRRRARRGRD